MKNTKLSQCDLLLKMFGEGRSVTRLTAMHHGVMNLTARISELRDHGYDVICALQTDEFGREYGSFSCTGRWVVGTRAATPMERGFAKATGLGPAKHVRLAA